MSDGAGIVTTSLNAAQIATLKKFTKDLSIDERITSFQEQLKKEYVYRVPLRYFTNLGKIHFPVKIDFRIKCHLEIEMKKIFESRKVLAAASAIPALDVKVIFTKAPFVQYEQLLFDKNFKQYLETIMVHKTPIQKT